jgi:hypothetical protein
VAGPVTYPENGNMPAKSSLMCSVGQSTLLRLARVQFSFSFELSYPESASSSQEITWRASPVGPLAVTEQLLLGRLSWPAPAARLLLALLVGGALAFGDLVERPPLRFHSYVGVAREHGARDVPGDTHKHVVARPRLGELRDQRMAIVVPAPDDTRFVARRFSRLWGDSNSLRGVDHSNFAVSQRFDVPHGRLAEETTVLAAELAYALVTDFIRRTRGINPIHQHPLPR